MDDEAWWSGTDPGPMMGFLQTSRRACQRQCRLFACACVRRIWPLLPDVACGRAVETAERFAGGQADVDALAAALAGIWVAHLPTRPAASAHRACWYAAYDGRAACRLDGHYGGDSPYHWSTAGMAAGHAREAAIWQAANQSQRAGRPGRHAMRAAKRTESQAQASLLRDIMGNPFCPTAVQAACVTPTVIALAGAAYQERELPSGHLDVARLAVLADALEEAGCSEAGLLSHLRGPGPHVRGCFALDGVLQNSAMLGPRTRLGQAIHWSTEQQAEQKHEGEDDDEC